MRVFKILILVLLNSSVAKAAAEVAQTFTIDGRLHTSSAANAPALLDSGVFRIQVLSPDASCMLYEESQSFNTATTDGYFSLAIGSVTGAAKRTVSDSGNGMATVFSNTIISGINGKLASDGSTNCTYNPVASAARLVRVKVTPVSDGVTRTLSPDLSLNSVPGAIVAERAESLQGLAPSSFLQLGTGSTTQSNIDNAFSATNYPRLTDLLSVGTGSYVRESANGAAIAPTVAGNAGSPSAGQFWYDTTANIMKYYDGSSVKSVGTVATASDLSSGTVGGSVAVNTSGNIATSGNITASGNGTTTGVITGQTIATNQVNANLLRMADAQGSPKFIEFKAPASVGASDLTYTWPAAFPGSNMVLQSDNAGTLSWVAQSGGGSGDLKADGTVAMSADWDLNGGTAGGTRKITGLDDPTVADGAAPRGYVLSAISTAAGSYVLKDGTAGLTADWDANGATAGGTRKITGLNVPTVADGAATKGYADINLRGQALATPVGQAGKSIRWNAGDTAWEYFTPSVGDALASGKLSQFAATSSSELAGVISDESGSGLLVYGTSPTLTTPTVRGFSLGGATSGGVGFSVAATGAAGNYVWPSALPGSNRILQSDSSGNLSWVAAGGTGDALVANPLSQFASTTSAQLAGVLSDETGTGVAVFGTSPTLTTPSIATSLSFAGSTSGSMVLQVPATVAGTYTWPAAAPGANRILQSDSSGNLSWVADVDTNSGGDALTSGKLSQFATTSSSELAGVLSDESGTGSVLLGTSPVITTPSLKAFTLSGATSGGITMQVNGTGAAGTYTWPDATPASNMILQSNNAGVLSWVSAATGTGDLRANGSVAMTANWDMNGATAGGSILLTGLGDPSVGDGAATKTYADANLRGNALATPVGQAGNSIRWNAGNTAWEYFAPITAIHSTPLTADWDVNGATANGTYKITGLIAPTVNDGAATKGYVDGAFVKLDGTTTMSADWDIDGGGASGTRKITGLTAPTTFDGATTKGYVDARILGATLAAPVAGDALKSIRWNAGGTAWEYYTPSTGSGDALTSGKLSQFAATSSSELAGVVNDETGSGLLVYGTTPTIRGFTLGGVTSGGVDFSVAATGAAGSYVWPAALPGSNRILQSDSSGNLSWVAAGGAGDLKADGTVAMSANWDMNGGTAGGSILLTGLADPSANDGAATKAFVDSAVSTAAGSYVTKDGLTGLTADWDANGGTAGGTRKITGLDVPTVADGAATKGYADINLRGQALATPVGQAGKSIRWNAGDTAWEYFTPSSGDALTTGKLDQFANTTSAELASKITDESGTGVLLYGTSPTIKGFILGGATSGGISMQVAGTGAAGNYTWPSAVPSSTLVLHSDNAGGLSWAAPVPADDTVNFDKLSDTMSLDTSTDIAVGSNVLAVTNDGAGNSFVVNDNTSSDATPFVIASDGKVGVGVPSPTVALDVAGQIAGAFTAHALNTAAMNLNTNTAVSVSISAATTLTTTVPKAGTRATIIIISSGTTSRIVTFGTGFRTVGTLATGTTNSRYFSINFVSDGTVMVETGRTAAM